MSQTWLIVGATRGIGLEFTTQLLTLGDTVIATARSLENAVRLLSLAGGPNGFKLHILECDVSKPESIHSFTNEVKKLGEKGGVLEGGVIDVVVLNAGILEYPGRISEFSWTKFQTHLQTNTLGPLQTASSLLSLPFKLKTLVFISSDSGSLQEFRSFEDGFGAYAVSKAGLNMGIRCLGAELALKRKKRLESGVEKGEDGEVVGIPVVLAMHPGEVDTDMCADAELGWEVKGVIEPPESIRCMLKIIGEKGYEGEDEGGKVSARKEKLKYEEGEASFWAWDGRRYPW